MVCCGMAMIMATKIQSRRPHGLSIEEALAAAIQVAKRVEERGGVGYSVSGNRIDISGKGVKGCIRVDDTHVEVEIELGLLLRPMRGLIEGKLDSYFERYFKPTGE